MNLLRITLVLLFPLLLFSLHAEEEEEEQELEIIQEEITEILQSDQGEELLEFVRDEFPLGTENLLKSILDEDPYEAIEQLEYWVEIKEEYYDLRRYRPSLAGTFLEFHKLEAQSLLLAQEIRILRANQANTSNIARIEQQLRDVLEKSFDLKLQFQNEELVDLERELSELRSLIEKRTSAKDTIIDRRYEELTGDTEYLEW